MPKHYVTFGQDHTHEINGKILHKDTVAVFDAPSAEEGREKAFKLFGDKFCFEYHGDEFDHSDIQYFPAGFTEL